VAPDDCDSVSIPADAVLSVALTVCPAEADKALSLLGVMASSARRAIDRRGLVVLLTLAVELPVRFPVRWSLGERLGVHHVPPGW
jgi:hypothetical protein